MSPHGARFHYGQKASGLSFAVRPSMVAVALLALITNLPAGAQPPVKTPEAFSFAVLDDTAAGVTVVIAEAPPGAGELASRIGFAAVCDRNTGERSIMLSFVSVPAGKAVQTAVRLPNGTIERFGPVVRGGGPRAGFHSPILDKPADVDRFLAAALTRGALISNGHNSVWNRISAEDNGEALKALSDCVNPAGQEPDSE